jgi:hypothetical protein
VEPRVSQHRWLDGQGRRVLASAWKFPVVTLFYERQLAELGDYAEPDDFTVEVLREQEIPALEKAWSFGRGVVQKRILAGHSCYVALLEGRIAHYSWVQTAGSHHIGSAGRQSPVQNGELWIYHCRTLDWAHGKRMFPTVLRRILRDHWQRRFRRALIYTTSDNVLSQRGILRAGFVPCGDCRSLLVGPWTFAWPPGQALPTDDR